VAAVRHLGFRNSIFLTIGADKNPFCVRVPNFVKIGQTVAEISRFSDFQDGGCRYLGFSSNRNFNGLSAVWGICHMCVIVPNFIKIGQTVAEIWRFNGF